MFEWFRFPYTRYNEINLDWILNEIKGLAADIPAVREAVEEATAAAAAATAAAEAAVEAVSTVTEQAAQAVATANAASQTATGASNTAATALSRAGQAQTAADAAQTTADGALAQADLGREEAAAAQADVDALSTYFNLNRSGVAILTPDTGATLVGADVRYILNNDGSLGKIYGGMVFSFATTNITYSIATNIYVKAPETAYDIARCGLGTVANAPVNSDWIKMRIAQDGRVYLILSSAAASVRFELYNSLIFFSNFGD